MRSLVQVTRAMLAGGIHMVIIPLEMTRAMPSREASFRYCPSLDDARNAGRGDFIWPLLVSWSR